MKSEDEVVRGFENPHNNEDNLEEPTQPECKSLLISDRVMERHNSEYVFKITFTEEGLEKLKIKYKNVRGLPAFLHNTLKGRPTPERELILENENLYKLTPDFKVIILPNRYNIEALRNNQLTVKDTPKGLALVGWAIDPRLLRRFGFPKNVKNFSFTDYLIENDKSSEITSGYVHCYYW